MKTVKFWTEVIAKLPEGTDPKDIEFRFDCGAHPPYSKATGEQVGHTTDFSVTEFWDDELVD